MQMSQPRGKLNLAVVIAEDTHICRKADSLLRTAPRRACLFNFISQRKL